MKTNAIRILMACITVLTIAANADAQLPKTELGITVGVLNRGPYRNEKIENRLIGSFLTYRPFDAGYNKLLKLDPGRIQLDSEVLYAPAARIQRVPLPPFYCGVCLTSICEKPTVVFCPTSALGWNTHTTRVYGRLMPNTLASTWGPWGFLFHWGFASDSESIPRAELLCGSASRGGRVPRVATRAGSQLAGYSRSASAMCYRSTELESVRSRHSST